MKKYYWLSFAVPNRGNLGFCVVKATSPKDAVEEATRQHINPGGEVAVFEIPDKYEKEINEFPINTLMTKNDKNIMNKITRLDFTDEVEQVCEHCNEELIHETEKETVS